MKKGKYIIGIIILCLIFFVGIEIFIKHDNNNTIEDKPADNIVQEQYNNVDVEEIKDGTELLENAEKILRARGWMGASNNVIGLKEGILYYYNEKTGEFRKIAKGIEDIYYKDEEIEEITAKKGKNSEEYGEKISFIIFE